MRIIVFLILSSFLIAQPIPVDSSKTVSKEAPTDVPPEVKPAVIDIVVNIEENNKVSTQINKEMKKQLELMQEIKSTIAQLNRHPKGVKITAKEVMPIDTVISKGLKPNELLIEVDGQMVQWETKNRTWVGRLLHKNDFIYYPFIVDKNGHKVYLK